MNTSALDTSTATPVNVAVRNGAAIPRPAPLRLTAVGCVSASARGRLERNSHTPTSAAHGIRSNAKDVENESVPASAIRITLDTIENDRSRRRGTSNAWRTCTHRNSDASGMRA